MQPDTSQKPVIELNNIVYRYPGSENNVINQLELLVNKNDRIGITAPNGSGKTTLFYLIMGLIKPDAGSIKVLGKEVKEEKDFESVRKKVGFLFQDADDQLFSPTVLEDVAFGPLNIGKSPSEAKAIARKILEQLHLKPLENRVTHQLSGGEKRMVSLAAVLAMEPEILLLDEPSNGLDEETKTRLLQFLSELNLTYLIISHDHDFLFELAKSNMTLKEGKLLPMGRMHKHYHSHPHTSHGHSH